jgi:hypothetical protein
MMLLWQTMQFFLAGKNISVAVASPPYATVWDSMTVADGALRGRTRYVRQLRELLGPRHREEQVKFVIAYGGAKPGHANFADIVAVDDEVIERLERCERRRLRARRTAEAGEFRP